MAVVCIIQLAIVEKRSSEPPDLKQFEQFQQYKRLECCIRVTALLECFNLFVETSETCF